MYEDNGRRAGGVPDTYTVSRVYLAGWLAAGLSEHTTTAATHPLRGWVDSRRANEGWLSMTGQTGQDGLVGEVPETQVATCWSSWRWPEIRIK